MTEKKKLLLIASGVVFAAWDARFGCRKPLEP